MTSTGYYRLPSNQDRLLPATLYTFYPAGYNPSDYTKNTRSCIWPRPVTTDYLLRIRTRIWGSGRPASVSNTPTRPCFTHRPDYSSVFTYGLSHTQYDCSNNIRRISGYRTLAYRASPNITVLSCLWTQLIPTCKILQINVKSSGFLHIYTRKVLQPHSKHYHQHPIYFPLCNHTWSHFGLWQSQVNTLSPIWYLHQNNADPSRFSHTYTRKVHLPHSKHYYQHPIYFPLCNTDLQVRIKLYKGNISKIESSTSWNAYCVWRNIATVGVIFTLLQLQYNCF